MKALYTVGYEGLTVPELIRLLRAEGIDVVLDVRDKPISRRAGFSKRGLGEALTQGGIQYLHAGFAGNPKALRDKATSVSDALARFEKHLDRHPEILEELSHLLAGFHRDNHRVALLCLERDPATCHRGILARRWASGLRRKVVSLRADDQ